MTGGSSCPGIFDLALQPRISPYRWAIVTRHLTEDIPRQRLASVEGRAQVLAPPSFAGDSLPHSPPTVRRTVDPPAKPTWSRALKLARKPATTCVSLNVRPSEEAHSNGNRKRARHRSAAPAPRRPDPSLATPRTKKGSARLLFVDLSFPNCAPLRPKLDDYKATTTVLGTRPERTHAR